MAEVNKQNILDALSKIKDPSKGNSIVDLGMIYRLEIEGNRLNLELNVPPLTKESKQILIQHCHEAVFGVVGDQYDINIHVLSEPPKSSNPPGLNAKNILAVASGKGGVGKSTVSVNLACTLAQKGFRVGLIDGDLYGPSIPGLMGLKGERPKMSSRSGKQMIMPLEKFGVYMISIGFIINPEQAVVLRGPRLSGVIKQFINDCDWPELDYLIVDLPPGTGDIQLTLVQTIAVTGSIVVTSPAQISVDDALRAANMFRLENINVPILGIVENMSWFTPKELPSMQYHLFGKGGGQMLSDQLNVPELAKIPLIVEAGESNDNGIPAAMEDNHPLKEYFSTLADKTIEKLAWRNANQNPTQKVKMN